jgi:hypothetical protein
MAVNQESKNTTQGTHFPSRYLCAAKKFDWDESETAGIAKCIITTTLLMQKDTIVKGRACCSMLTNGLSRDLYKLLLNLGWAVSP